MSVELVPTRNAGQSLHYVDVAEARREGEVGLAVQRLAQLRIEFPVRVRREARVEGDERVSEAVEVLRVRVRDEVKVLGRTNAAVRNHGNRTDHDTPDLCGI